MGRRRDGSAESTEWGSTERSFEASGHLRLRLPVGSLVSPPRLPPLGALHAFEVAARHLSFKHAADELSITPTAVSHRIRNLEDWLGLKLFNRLTRSLELTRDGDAYAVEVHRSFDLLVAASESLRRSTESGDLVVATTMSFASNWLAPRLARFRELHEDLTVRIEASDILGDLTRTDADISIRYGEGNYEGVHSERLFQDLISPACAPSMARRLDHPRDLLNLQLLDYRWADHSDRDPTWDAWFAAAGLGDIETSPSTSFSEEHMVIAQARDGAGIALAGTTATANAILEGRLVRPFPIALENHSYYITCLPSALSRQKVRVFHDWLRDEAVNFEETLATHPDLCFETIVGRADLP